jgi:hypothetical protein
LATDNRLSWWNMSELVVWVDSNREVVSVRRAGARVVTSRDAQHDGYLYLDLDEREQVVGVRLVAANEMPPEYWMKHPDRCEIPPDLLAKLDETIPTVYRRRHAH